ncbi:MAG: class I SAM-dependent methyltransferase [Pseudomonadota bacterium]
MIHRLIVLLRRLIGTQQIAEMLAGDGQRPPYASWIEAARLTLLPGTSHSRYAIPVEYMPSRDFRPRYGYSRDKIMLLDRWFESHAEIYREFLNYMRTLDVDHIAQEWTPIARRRPAWKGGPICAFDSLALYAMIRKHTPRIYFEIGSGMTTRFARQAVEDGKLATRVVSIDPEPRGDIDELCDEVLRTSLEECDVSIFDQLEAGDILFFDGSHRIFMNSDVTVFFIEVLPRIKPGVIVHIHDIVLPWDYPETFRYWYWNEQYMLAVYMMAAQDSLLPMLPTTFVCRSPLFEQQFAQPFVDLGAEENVSWRGGGSMWFCKKP